MLGIKCCGNVPLKGAEIQAFHRGNRAERQSGERETPGREGDGWVGEGEGVGGGEAAPLMGGGGHKKRLAWVAAILQSSPTHRFRAAGVGWVRAE
jgi:hypothetical protein